MHAAGGGRALPARVEPDLAVAGQLRRTGTGTGLAVAVAVRVRNVGGGHFASTRAGPAPMLPTSGRTPARPSAGLLQSRMLRTRRQGGGTAPARITANSCAGPG